MCKTRHENDVFARIPIPYTAPAPAALPRRALDPPYNYIPANPPPQRPLRPGPLAER